MAGRRVTVFDSVYPHLRRVHEDAPVTGRTIDDVQAVGKHLLFTFSGGLVLRSHLRMNGRWDIYRTGERWKHSVSGMRVVIGTDDYVAVAFDVVDVAFYDARTLRRDSPVGRLGPDLLQDPFDEEDALRRLRQPPDDEIAAALLHQWRLAGIGNVYKSETLFLCRINPFRRVSSLSDDELRALVRKAQVLMKANVTAGSSQQIVTYRALRQTTGRFNPADRLWVYGRIGRPCRRCGTRIEMKRMGEGARSTYWCQRCQPGE
jgi:endonuclease-8